MKKYFFLEYNKEETVEHDMKKATYEFFKFCDVEIKIMNSIIYKEIIVLNDVDIKKKIISDGFVNKCEKPIKYPLLSMIKNEKKKYELICNRIRQQTKQPVYDVKYVKTK